MVFGSTRVIIAQCLAKGRSHGKEGILYRKAVGGNSNGEKQHQYLKHLWDDPLT